MKSLNNQGFYNDSTTIENNDLNNGIQLLSSINEQFLTWVTHGKNQYK